MPTMLNSLCLNGGNLLCLPGGGDVKVLRSGDLGGGGREEDLDVTRVTLVRVAVKSAELLGVMALGDTLSPETVSPKSIGISLTFDRGLGKSSSWSWGPG
jgi:hypothetical protein